MRVWNFVVNSLCGLCGLVQAMEAKERRKVNGRWKRFCKFDRNGWYLLQWSKFWTRSLVHWFWFCRMGCFGNSSFSINEGGIKMMSLSILVVGILIGLMLAPMVEALEKGTFFDWGDENEHERR